MLKSGKASPHMKDEAQDPGFMEIRNMNETMSTNRLQGDIWGHKSLRSLLQSVKEEAERKAIVMALEKTGWNRKAAARLLKTSYRSVLYKIEQYQLSLPDSSSIPPSNGLTSGKFGPRGIGHANFPLNDLPGEAGGESTEG